MNDVSGLKEGLTRTLTRVRTLTGVSMAFGGPVSSSGVLRLDYFAGLSTGALPGTVLSPNEGLGGRSAALRRSIVVNDYFRSDRITHRYDSEVRAEGLKSVVAMPVVVDRKPVAVIYGAFRGSEVIGDRIQDAITAEARALEQELVARAVMDARQTPPDQSRLREQIRDAHRALHLLNLRIDQPELRLELERITRGLAGGDDVRATTTTPLTAREVDVVTLVAAGMPNRQIASTLGLSPHTVKSYMQTVMSKLAASTRFEAVVHARRDGIIP
jgi:DNA-binding CsgD family transcriptional regulator